MFAVSIDPGRAVGGNGRMQSANHAGAAVFDDAGDSERDVRHGRIDSDLVASDNGAADIEKAGFDCNTLEGITGYTAVSENDCAAAKDDDAFLFVAGNVHIDQSCPALGCTDADPVTRDNDVSDGYIRAPVVDPAVKNGCGASLFRLAVDDYAMPRDGHAPCAGACDIDGKRLTPVPIHSYGVVQRIAGVAVDIDRDILRRRAGGPQSEDQAQK